MCVCMCAPGQHQVQMSNPVLSGWCSAPCVLGAGVLDHIKLLCMTAYWHGGLAREKWQLRTARNSITDGGE